MGMAINTSKKKIKVAKDQRLVRNLLKGYNKNTAPIVNEQPVNVTMKLIVYNLVSIETLHMHQAFEVKFDDHWMDHRLVFNRFDYIAERNLSISLTGDYFESFWLPDLYFPLAKEVKVQELAKPNKLLSIKSDGSMHFSQRQSMVTYCKMDLTYFPYDHQKCNLSIQSFGFDDSYINLFWRENIENGNPVKLLDSTDSFQFEINLIRYGRTKVKRNDRYFDELFVEFLLKRYSSYYILAMYIPCILVVILSWVGFWIDYRSTPARVSLGITTVLTMVTLGNSIRSSLPPVNYTKSLDAYVMVCVIFVFTAFLECCIVGITGKKWNYIVENETKKSQRKEFSKLVARHFPSRYIRNQQFDSNIVNSSKQHTNLTKIQIESSTTGAYGFEQHQLNKLPIRRNSIDEINTQEDSVDTKKSVNNKKHKVSKYKVSKLNKLSRVSVHLKEKQNELQKNMFRKQRQNMRIHIIDKFMRKLFPISFVFFNVTYFIISLIS